MQPLRRLFGNGANATVFRIAATHSYRRQPALTPVQEIVAVDLRETLLWSLDDPMAVVREFLNPTMSRSGLDPCLRRHGAGRLRDRKAKDGTPKHSGLKPYGLGHLHIDVKYPPCMANETSRGYFFVTIDRASRWVFIAMYRHKTAATAQRFLGDLERACPIRSRTILTGMARRSLTAFLVCAGALQHDRTRLIRCAQPPVLNTG